MFMKNTFRKCFPVLITFALLLAACGAPAPQDTTTISAPSSESSASAPSSESSASAPQTTSMPASSAAAKEPVTLKVMNWSQEQADFYKEAAVEFQKEYPHITVQWDTLAQDKYRETLPLMFQSGDAPDIFFWIGQNRVLTMNELLAQDWIAPIAPEGADLGEWQARWPKDTFVDGINVHEGKVYSFPFNDNVIWGPGYMFLNKEIFRQAGLNPDNPPKTWSELRETCQQIKEQADTYCIAAPLKGTHFQRIWYPIAGSIMTDSFFDLKNGRFSIDDPRMIKAVEFIQQLYKDELVVPGVNDHTFARQAMATGQAAIYFDGAWMPSTFKQMGFADLDLGVASPPAPEEGQSGALSRTYSENKFYVSSKTEHPEEAWLFLEWMTRPDGYFAKEYLGRGFGTLAYTDNGKYITDPAMLEVVKVSENLRVLNPEPAIACSGVSQSKAYLEAENFHKNWEWEAMVEAVSTGADFAPIAQEIATKKNEIFTQKLKEEQSSGLDISQDCYTFNTWEYNKPFDVANYTKR